ncbi:MAG: SufD family Fe-S cluster assembly protein, partial [Thermoplasmata archaeon]|nr:SufD family Fe-S cluster assembly protein [Candidatus Sysuiplasma superficiale]
MTAMTQDIMNTGESELPSFNMEPAWLSEYRRRSLAVFRQSRPEPNPLYTKYESLTRFDASGLTPAKVPSELPAVPERYVELAGEEGKSIFMIHYGGAFYRSKSLPRGVIFEEMKDAVAKHADIAEESFRLKGLKPEDDIYVALNNAFFTSGYFLYVPRNTHLEAPVHVVYIENGAGKAGFHQNIVRLEEGSSANVIEEIYSEEGVSGLSLYSSVTDVHLSHGAELHHASLENLSAGTVYLSNKRAIAMRESRMHWVSSYMGGDITRARSDTDFEGQGASTDDYEILFSGGKQKFDIVTDLHHNVESTSGRVTVRSVLRDRSRALLRGMIRIGEKASNTSAYLAEHGMLLSRDSKCDAIPGLEILTNGVKATHSASVSQMDEQQLYYLQTRGIERNDA